MALGSGGKGRFSMLRDIKAERGKQPKNVKLRIQWKKKLGHDIARYCNPCKIVGGGYTFHKKRNENSGKFVFKDQTDNR